MRILLDTNVLVRVAQSLCRRLDGCGADLLDRRSVRAENTTVRISFIGSTNYGYYRNQ